MMRSVRAGLSAIAIALVGCTGDDSVSGEGSDAAVPLLDATNDVTIGQHDASGAHDANGGADANDATVADAGVDAVAETGADVGADAVADAGPDVLDAGPPEDAFSFPDAQSLSGLHFAILGNPGASSESMLDAYLATAGTVTRLEDANDAGTTLDASTLAGFDVVILDQLIRSYTAGEAQALADWVAAGHGVLSLTGYAGNGTDGARPASLLAALGLGYDLSALESNGNVTALAPHPLMDGVAFLNFQGGYGVTIAGADSGVDAGAPVVVAMLDTTRAALVASDFGQGRVVVWGDEWISYDSEFQNNQGTERFWNNAMLWLTHRK